MSTLLLPEDELFKIPYVCANILHMSRSAFYKDEELKKLIIKIGRASYVSKIALQELLARKRNERKAA